MAGSRPCASSSGPWPWSSSSPPSPEAGCGSPSADQDGLKAGTLISETASEALVGPHGRGPRAVGEPAGDRLGADRRRPRTASGPVTARASSASRSRSTGRRTCWWPTGCPTARCRTRPSRWSPTRRNTSSTGSPAGSTTTRSPRSRVASTSPLKGEPEEISLRVGYDGVDQVVDGLTGGLDRDAAEPLYELGFASGAQPCGDPLWSPGASDVGENVTDVPGHLVGPAALRRRPRLGPGGQELDGGHRADRARPTEFDGPDGTYEVAESDVDVPPRRPGPGGDLRAQRRPARRRGRGHRTTRRSSSSRSTRTGRPGQFEVRTRLTGETEVTTGKKGNRETKTKTFEALVAQGAFV